MGPGKTVRDLLLHGQSSLQGSASARLDAELLLAKSMNTERASLYAHPEQSVAGEQVAAFEAMLDRRRLHFPLAYLVGEREFWSLPLALNQHTLIPRPETEVLVETALQLLTGQQGVAILDLGTGSGAIALALASERNDCQVLAVDCSEAALQVAAGNARRHAVRNIEFLRSDWFSALAGRQFALIVSNPPYVESGDAGFRSGEIRYEPRLALDGGVGGLQSLQHIIPVAREFLSEGGSLIVEHGSRQAEPVRGLFADANYQALGRRVDYAGLDRVSYGRYP